MFAIFPEISNCAQKGDLERLSVLLRTYFAGSDASRPRLNARQLVRQFGLLIGSAPIKYFGAIAVKDLGGDIKASMLIRDGLSESQQAFLIAHMLGHFVLQIQPRIAKTEWSSSGFKEFVDPLERYATGAGTTGLTPQEFATEDLADRFAGALLMPMGMVRRAAEKLQSSAKIAAIFGVTAEAVERRLEDLNGHPTVAATSRAGARVAKAVDVLNQLADSTKPVNEVPPEQLMRDVSQPVPSMPRAVAAHSYQDVAQAEQVNNKLNAPSGLKGMDRIRELARKLDKFGDKSNS